MSAVYLVSAFIQSNKYKMNCIIGLFSKQSKVTLMRGGEVSCGGSYFTKLPELVVLNVGKYKRTK